MMTGFLFRIYWKARVTAENSENFLEILNERNSEQEEINQQQSKKVRLKR
jgi:hypothetical protein